jgi:hypothetical protein
VPPRIIQEVVVDYTKMWAYFDGASQQNNLVWGGRGAIFYLKENNVFKMKMGLGLGTKKYAEPMSLKLLLLFVGEKGVKAIHILGDSLNVINWVRKTQKCHNIQLITLLKDIFILLGAFDIPFPPYLPLSIIIPLISPHLGSGIGFSTLGRVVPCLVRRRG